MKAPMSALAKYLLDGYVSNNIKKQFLDQTMGVNGNSFNKKNQFYSENVYGLTIIDSTKNKCGEKLTKENEFYTLSQIISSFKEGERTVIKKDNWKIYRNLENYFEKKGIHFCVGYLSTRFGEVVKPTLNVESIFDNIPYIFHKLTERKQFEAAQNVWFKHKYGDLKNLID